MGCLHISWDPSHSRTLLNCIFGISFSDAGAASKKSKNFPSSTASGLSHEVIKGSSKVRNAPTSEMRRLKQWHRTMLYQSFLWLVQGTSIWKNLLERGMSWHAPVCLLFNKPLLVVFTSEVHDLVPTEFYWCHCTGQLNNANTRCSEKIV
jgi:hypothetical protein